MTGVELGKYLIDSGLFKDECVYMVEVDNNGEILSNRVPSYYKMFIPNFGRFEIRIYYTKHSDGTKWVDFNAPSNNLFASHKLKDMDFKTLYNELSKILSHNQKFIDWSTKELRDYKIKSLYEKQED